MPANTSPLFVLVPNTPTARVAAANTARDGSGTLVTLFTAGANGSRVDEVAFTSAQATAAASSAMVGRLFITDNAGANPRLLREIALPTVTPSNTVVGQQQIISFPGGLLLANGQLLKCTISVFAGVQDQYDVNARGGDF